MKKILAFLFITFFLVFSLPVFAVGYPEKPEGFVNDYADLTSESKQTELEQRLSDFEKETTNEIAVVTIESLEGISIEEYAVELFEKWGIGKKEQDNGILFLIAYTDKEMRIEVGYGLEGDLTDAGTKMILENDVKPLFRQDRYEEGIEAGVNQIMRTIKGEIDPALTSKEDATSGGFFGSLIWALFSFIWQIGGVIVFIVVIIILIKIRGGGIGPGTYWGSGSSGGFGRGSGGGGFGGFGGGSSGGGGSSSSW